jgi:hypothetical protein
MSSALEIQRNAQQLICSMWIAARLPLRNIGELDILLEPEVRTHPDDRETHLAALDALRFGQLSANELGSEGVHHLVRVLSDDDRWTRQVVSQIVAVALGAHMRLDKELYLDVCMYIYPRH